jgi:WD40 repeat protein
VDRRTFALAAALLVRGTAPAAPAPFRRPPRPVRITASNFWQLRELASAVGDWYQAVWSPDGKRVALAGPEKDIEIREAETLRRLAVIGAKRKLTGFAFSPHDDVAAVCDSSRRAEILNLRTGKSIMLATGLEHCTALFSPDGKTLVTGGYGTQAKLWDASTGKLLRSFETGGVAGFVTVAFSPEGDTLAVCNRTAGIRLFDPATGRARREIDVPHPIQPGFRRDGKVVAAVAGPDELWLFEASSGERLARTEVPADAVSDLDWSAGGDVLAVVGPGAGLMLFGAWDLRLLNKPDRDKTMHVQSPRFSPDGSRLLVTVRPDKVAECKVSLLGVA